VFRAKGLSGATTREIAREVGCADGTLYVHFDDRLALFLAVLERTLPGFLIPLRALEHRVGERTVRANLEEVLHGALGFQNQIIPMMASFFAEPELLEGFRDVLHRRKQGPRTSIRAVEDYIRAEQERGRIPKRVQPRAVAFALLGSCFYRSFLNQFLGDSMSPNQGVFVRGIIGALDLRPRRATSSPKPSTKAGPRPATAPGSEARLENPASTTPPDSHSRS